MAGWVNRIADDSTRGRDTPSPELDRLAGVIADEFRAAGLTPGGDSGGYLQRYPLTTRRIQPGYSRIEWRDAGGMARTLGFGAEVGFAQGTVPSGPISGPVVLLGGAIDAARIPAARLRDRIVLWAADLSPAGAAKVDGIAATLISGAPAAVIIVPSDPGIVRGMVAAQPAERLATATPGLVFTAVTASEAAIGRSDPGLAARIRQSRTRPVTTLDSTAITMTVTIADTAAPAPLRSAPNVVAIRPGTDPARRDQYIVVSAHMDHLGVVAGPDSIMNGADDNASGTAGILMLARALQQPGLVLGRSVILLLVSGEEKGLWGSAHFVAHPPVPLDHIVAEINLDMIGRGWRDTVGVIGREFSGLGRVLDSVAGRHPELGVTPIGDVWPDEKRFFRSDHYSFARRGVPSLFLSSGYSPDYHAPTDSPDKIDAAKEARLLRLVASFVTALANRKEPVR